MVEFARSYARQRPFFLSKMTSLLSIDAYTTKFDAYPADLVAFAAENGVKLPAVSSLRGQALALLSQPDVRGTKHIGPAEAVAFFKAIGMETRDAIQPFNKATGIKRMDLKKGLYCIAYPYMCDKTDIDKRKGAAISGDRDAAIDSIKDWWRTNLVDVPNDKWQVGHLDPTIPDASEKNLAFQPPIQGKYRDRFKWDPLFFKMWPTGAELAPKLDTYYTEAEQRMLYEALKAKFERK